MSSVLFVFGTRPEAVKLAPVVRAVRDQQPSLRALVCVTAQHRALLDQVLSCFDLRPDFDLDLMTPGQTLAGITARVLTALDPILVRERPAMLAVQGDTTTTMAAALAAFYRRIPIAHIEAGLRTGDLARPFPEELNRAIAGKLADLHFAPTERALRNLIAEGVPPDRVTITGNSGIDAVLHVSRALETGALAAPAWPWLDARRKLLLVTAHRRESFGGGIERICLALAELARRDDVQIAYPVHPNPNVLGPVTRALGGRPNIALLDPLEYPAFVDLMRRARFLLTDSGGVQEEAPSLGKPVLVFRDSTERPEAVDAGTVLLVGTDPRRIVAESTRLLDDEDACRSMSRIHNPYGDGHAAERIARAIAAFHTAPAMPPENATA